MTTADDIIVTVDGDTVVKIHRAGTDPHEPPQLRFRWFR